MRFAPDETQRQLQDSVRRFAQAHEGIDDWRRGAREHAAFRPAVWDAIAGMGWLAAAVPQDAGGLGLGARECGIVMEGVGQALLLEPYWSTAVFGTQLLLAGASPSQQQQLLPLVATGALRLAVALAEPGTRFDWSEVRCEARRSGDGWTLSGTKLAVLDGAVADRLLLLARTEQGEVALFCTEVQGAGLRRRDGISLDERRCSDFFFDRMPLPPQARLDGRLPAVQAMRQAMAWGMAALAAEASGSMASVLRDTVEYLKTRRQFGRPLSEFQVLRHRVADMLMATEQTRSLALLAAALLDAGSPDAARVATAAKVQAGQAGRFVGESAVQLHGGIGVTDELRVGHHLKRLLCIDLLLGDAAFHLQGLADSDPQLAAPS